MTAAREPDHRAHPEPREDSSRCSVRAERRGDPMLGTAFPASRVLLVEQAGPWGRDALRDSRLPAAVAAALRARAEAAGVRVQLIRRVGRTPGGAARAMHTWAFADTRAGTVRWGSVRDPAALAELPLDGTAGELDPDPVYLVCAHGSHDACCAIRGRAVAAALDAQRPGRVWETTHLGGDRFAANVLVLPTGLVYGHVPAAAAPAFVAAADSGEVVVELLRGRIGLPPAAQVALGRLHALLGIRRADGVRVAGWTPVVDGVSTVTVAAGERLFAVRVGADTVAVDGLTCTSPGRGYMRRHRALEVTEVTEARRIRTL